jgi:hypothetical protein
MSSLLKFVAIETALLASSRDVRARGLALLARAGVEVVGAEKDKDFSCNRHRLFERVGTFFYSAG